MAHDSNLPAMQDIPMAAALTLIKVHLVNLYTHAGQIRLGNAISLSPFLSSNTARLNKLKQPLHPKAPYQRHSSLGCSAG